jgi:hypothetical protein
MDYFLIGWKAQKLGISFNSAMPQKWQEGWSAALLDSQKNKTEKQSDSILELLQSDCQVD